MARNLCVVPGLPESAEIARSIRFKVSRVTHDFWRTSRTSDFRAHDTNAGQRWNCGSTTVLCLRIHQEYIFSADGEYLFAKVLHIFRVISVRAACVWVIKNT